jgi:hypothetical protein
MHHAHVKRKEKPMNRYVMEEFYNDPALRRRLFERARKERNRAIRDGLSWLRRGIAARLLARPAHWIEQLG